MLPLLLLLPAGYCLMMSMFNEGILSTYGVPLGIFILVLSLVLTAIAQYYFTDRVFFDRKAHEVWQEARCFGHVREEFRLSFDQVTGIALSGKWTTAKYGSYWEFTMVIVSKTGIIKPVSLDFREGRFKHYTEIACTISEFVGSKFVEPNIKLPRLVIESSGTQSSITYRVGKMGQGW